MTSRASWLIAGAILGFLGGAWWGGRHELSAHRRFWREGPDTRLMIAKLTNRFQLDPSQQAAVKQVLESYKGRIAALHQETRSKFRAVQLGMRADIEKALNPDQRRRFKERTAAWDARHPDLSGKTTSR